MKASDLLVRSLEAEGVKTIFAVPGEENLDLIESLRLSSIRLVVTRHEQAAGFMAATLGRLTGRPGVVLSTLGPGATNLVTAAAYAQLGAMPMVMLTGQKPIRTSKQGAFQIIDVVGMMRPLTKYTRQVVGADGIPSQLREAFRLAREERPGAAHLEIPEDILRDRSDAEPLESGFVRIPVAEEESVQKAADLLAGARRPLLVIGSGANRTRACRRLDDFVTALGIPFLTTQMGKGVVDEASDLYVGTAALSSGDFVHRAVEAADVIVNVGHTVVEKPPFIMEHNGVRVVHVDFSPARVDPVYFPHVEVVGDIADAFERLRAALQGRSDWDFSHVSQIRRAARDHFHERAASDEFPMRPERLVRDVRSVLPGESVVTLDNGLYKLWFARSYEAHGQNSLLLDNALATMGAGFPSAMAARMVHPDRPVVAVCGDGGFMMNSQELETAVRLELDLVVVVLRDDGYGMIRWKQEELGFPDYGLSYGNPDFVAYAEAYGARGHRVTAAHEFAPLLERCVRTQGVDVVELPITYAHDNRVLNEEIPALARALSLPPAHTES
ncbi:MAG: acetolactate synthase large subunit [Gemmatimonadales bacterium]|nr:MAG: acetolactate synthase large subunit [Gemmatimonadales bacterium]